MILAAALALLCGAAPARATSDDRARVETKARRFANVIQVAGSTAFLDAGLEHGLGLDAEVELSRAGVRIGACRITAVSDHHAACAPVRAMPRDRARLSGPPAPRPVSLPLARTPREVIDRLREAVLFADVPRVPFAGARTPVPARLPDRVAASGGATAWASTAEGATAVERVDVSGRGAIRPGTEGAVRFAVERWSDAEDRRFRPGQSWQLYVWQARITQTLGAGALTVGRFLPGDTIGQPIIDGVQASREVGQRTTMGVYAGAVPVAVSTAPSLRYPTAALQLASTGGWDRAVQLGGSARVGIVGAPSGLRVDAEASAHAYGRRADIAASVQGVSGSGASTLSALRFDASGRPWDALVVSAGYREFRASALDVQDARAIASSTQRGDAEVRWTISPGLWAGGEVNAQRDLDTRLDRVEFGPAFGVTNVFGSGAGFRAAWRQERGWFAASGLDLAWWWPISRRLRAAGSVSVSGWQRLPDSRDVDVWASASIVAAIVPWASLRASLSGNGGAFAAPGAPYRSVPGGAIGALSLNIYR